MQYYNSFFPVKGKASATGGSCLPWDPYRGV